MGTGLAHFLGIKQPHHAHLFFAVRVQLSVAPNLVLDDVLLWAQVTASLS